MVINKTNAVEVNIQAVSPPLILSAPTKTGSVGAAGAATGVDAAGAAADAGASSAQATGIASTKDAARTNRDSMDISESPLR